MCTFLTVQVQGRFGDTFEGFKQKFAADAAGVIRDGLALPINAELSRRMPTPRAFADWVYAALALFRCCCDDGVLGI